MAHHLVGGEYELVFNGVELDAVRDGDAVAEGGARPSSSSGATSPARASRCCWRRWASCRRGSGCGSAATGPETEVLRRQVAGDVRIEWLGRLSDREKMERLKAADVFCAPSLHGESFGVVLIEAMAASTAVVASDLPGYANVARAGRDALLVPPGDAAPWRGPAPGARATRRSPPDWWPPASNGPPSSRWPAWPRPTSASTSGSRPAGRLVQSRPRSKALRDRNRRALAAPPPAPRGRRRRAAGRPRGHPHRRAAARRRDLGPPRRARRHRRGGRPTGPRAHHRHPSPGARVACPSGRPPPTPSARLVNLADGLSATSGVPVPDLFVLDDPGANMLLVGESSATPAVVVTSGLLDALDRIQLESVVAWAFAELRQGELPAASRGGDDGGPAGHHHRRRWARSARREAVQRVVRRRVLLRRRPRPRPPPRPGGRRPHPLPAGPAQRPASGWSGSAPPSVRRSPSRPTSGWPTPGCRCPACRPRPSLELRVEALRLL